MAAPREIRSPGEGCALKTIIEESPTDNRPRQQAQDRPRMTLEAFKPVVKGVCRGFATVRLRNGLVIADCVVCTSHGKSWASLPSKPLLDREGRHIVDDNGKKKYVPILSWPDRATTDLWSASVVALVRQHHPGALAGEAVS